MSGDGGAVLTAIRSGRATPAPPSVFLFDANRCTGCAACALACSTENGLPWGLSWRQIVPFNPERRPGTPSFHLSLACNHCADAPCVAHCPTGAMGHDPVTGSVLVDEARCIGCRYCAWVCPYDAPRFDEGRGVMTKCTLCNHRLLEGRGPACAEGCPTGALGFGAPQGQGWTDALPGFPEGPARPRIAFPPLRRDAHPPRSSWTLAPDVAAAYLPHPTTIALNGPPSSRWGANALSLRAELPLLLFTSGAAALVGWVLAAALGAVAMKPWSFAVAAALTLLVSTRHLARPAAAWRGAVNVRTSHLSREVVGYVAFLAVAAWWLVTDGIAGDAAAAARTPSALRLAALLLGIAAMFLMDRVYDPVRPCRTALLHPGDALPMAPLLAAAFAQAMVPFLVLAAVKGALHAVHAWHHPAGRRRARGVGLGRSGSAPFAPSVLAALAVGGLLAPPLVWGAAPTEWGWLGALFATAGAVADRARLYLELRIPTPGDAARRDAAAWGA